MAYTPISTMFNTPYSSTTVLSPLTPITFSPLPPITTAVTQSVIVNNDPFTVVTPIGPILHNLVSGPRYLVDVDTGINDNYIVQIMKKLSFHIATRT